jgi:hypothetical protein
VISHLQEAHALRALSAPTKGGINNFARAYLGNGSIRIPPLLLAALSPLIDNSLPEIWLSIILLLVDVGIAYLLDQIGRCVLMSSKDTSRIQQEEKRQRELPKVIQPENDHIFPIYTDDKESKSLIPMSGLPLLAAQLYYWSPCTALPSCLYSSWQNLPSLFLLASIYQACSDNRSFTISSFLLAIAVYLEPYYVVFSTPAMILFFYGSKTASNKQTTSSMNSTIGSFIGLLALWSMCFQYLTYSLVGRTMYWRVLCDVYGDTWLSSSPNLSVQWYFRMQLFSRFHDYFGAIFLGLPFVLIAPLTVRLWKYPEALVSADMTLVIVDHYSRFVNYCHLISFAWPFTDGMLFIPMVHLQASSSVTRC